MTEEKQTLEAIKAWLNLQDTRLAATLQEGDVWGGAWNEAWGGQQVLKHLYNILENGTWNGEVYIPYE